PDDQAGQLRFDRGASDSRYPARRRGAEAPRTCEVDMALAAGSRLGCYEIVAQFGAGGMGEVYRATDTKLGREVAIKVLPSSFYGNRLRRALCAGWCLAAGPVALRARPNLAGATVRS